MFWNGSSPNALLRDFSESPEGSESLWSKVLSETQIARIAQFVGRISDLLKILLAYLSFSWKKELHVVAGDLSGTNDIARSTRMVAWVDRGA